MAALAVQDILLPADLLADPRSCMTEPAVLHALVRIPGGTCTAVCSAANLLAPTQCKLTIPDKHLHAQGWLRLLREREELLSYSRQRLAAFAEQHDLRLLHTPGNPISMALALPACSPGDHISPHHILV